jgi:hypothetical protein
VAELRAVNPIAASNLERDLIELAGGVRVEYVDNADRSPLNEPAAAVPVDTGETYRLPAVTTEPYRVKKEDTA